MGNTILNKLGLDGETPFDVYLNKTTPKEAIFKLISVDGLNTPKNPLTYIIELHDADGVKISYKVYEHWGVKNTLLNEYKVYTIYEAHYKPGDICAFQQWNFMSSVYEDKPCNLLEARIVGFIKSGSNLDFAYYHKLV